MRKPSNVTSLGLPGNSVPLLLQQFVPVFPHPLYFKEIYIFLSHLNSLKSNILAQLTRQESSSCHGNIACTPLIELVTEKWPILINVVDEQGLSLLLGHVTELFRLPKLSADLVRCIFNVIVPSLSQSVLVKHLLHVIQDVYDTPTEPYSYAYLLQQPFLSTVIRAFGLRIFLRYFLLYVRDAVLDPSGVRFPYLKQRPVDGLVREKKHSNRPSYVNLEETFPFSIDVGSPSPSPFPTPTSLLEGDSEEETMLGEGEGAREEKGDYAEYSILLQADMQSHEVDHSSEHSPAIAQNSLEILDEADFVKPLLTSEMEPVEEDSTLFPFVGEDPVISIESKEDSILDARSFRQSLTEEPDAATVTVDQKDAPVIQETHATTDERRDLKSQESADDKFVGKIDDKMRDTCMFLSKVSRESLNWLMRYLGPILGTKHIAQPLLEGLPRSFVAYMRGQTKSVLALECISHMIGIYGNVIITDLLLPRVSSWVSNNGTKH